MLLFLCLLVYRQSGPQSGASRLQPYTQDKEKSVRFDDILDDEASGQIGDIRRKLKMEQQRARKRAQVNVTLEHWDIDVE